MKRHDTDPVSLVAGLLFLSIVAVWALNRSDVLRTGTGWVFPAILLVIGAVGLASALPKRRVAEPLAPAAPPDAPPWVVTETPRHDTPVAEPPGQDTTVVEPAEASTAIHDTTVVEPAEAGTAIHDTTVIEPVDRDK